MAIIRCRARSLVMRQRSEQRTSGTQRVLLSDDGFGTVEAPGDWLQPGQGVGTASVFLTKTAEASAAVLRIWHQAKGACWALPSSRTRHLLSMMVRYCLPIAARDACQRRTGSGGCPHLPLVLQTWKLVTKQHKAHNSCQWCRQSARS
jgi:hypothetical protein